MFLVDKIYIFVLPAAISGHAVTTAHATSPTHRIKLKSVDPHRVCCAVGWWSWVSGGNREEKREEREEEKGREGKGRGKN